MKKDTDSKFPYIPIQKKECDIQLMIGKTPDKMISIIGSKPHTIKNPKDCANLSACELEQDYKNKHITILYENNHAAWFEFDNMKSHEWTHLPETLGLEDKLPDISNEFYSWYSYPGIKKIAFVPLKNNHGYVDYIIVTAY